MRHHFDRAKQFIKNHPVEVACTTVSAALIITFPRVICMLDDHSRVTDPERDAILDMNIARSYAEWIADGSPV